jgi:predicted transcriptional regulator
MRRSIGAAIGVENRVVAAEQRLVARGLREAATGEVVDQEGCDADLIEVLRPELMAAGPPEPCSRTTAGNRPLCTLR